MQERRAACSPPRCPFPSGPRECVSREWRCRSGSETAPDRRRGGCSARPLVEVGLKPALRDRVVRAAHARFKQAKEAFNRLRVDVALDVDALAVANSAVPVLLANSVVA